MRIGIMLRSWDEKGGVGVYTQNLVTELLHLDRKNEYVLFYRSAANLGRFGHLGNVAERLIEGRSKALWDQVSIPLACRREKVDVVFHPKFTAPLLAPCKAVMVVHGADWFMPEQARFYGWLDVRYIRAVMPLYFRKCSLVLSVSQLTTDNFRQVLKLPPEKIRTVYFAPARHFQRVVDGAKLADVASRYALPERFILTLTKQGGDSRKNFGRLLEAYAKYHTATPNPHRLVIGGQDCDRLRAAYAVPENGYGRDILFPGWIDQEDLPSVYSLCDLFLYPSNLEAFPIPITEAMACGTPIITSDANGLREIAEDAALRVDPENASAIAQTIERVLGDGELRSDLSARGLARSRNFSWEKCARETLDALEEVGSGAPAS